jgi:hypothetical protein
MLILFTTTTLATLLSVAHASGEYVARPDDEGGGGGGGEDVVYELNGAGHFNLVQDEHVRDESVFASLRRYGRYNQKNAEEDADLDTGGNLTADELALTRFGRGTNGSTNGSFDDGSEARLNAEYFAVSNLVRMAFLSVIYMTIIICTLIGNLLVILAVIIVRKLHSQDNANNYLIVSLATSDMLVGLLAMPFSFYVEISKGNR